MSNRDTAATLDYHEATKHSERSLRASRHFLEWDNQPLAFKIYRDLDAIPLSQGFPGNDLPALEAISKAVAAPAAESDGERIPDLAALSRTLHLSAGITKRKRHPGGETLFRAYPNAGALHHIDLYLVAGELPGLSAGVYHFGPHDFALRRLREGDCRAVLVEASGRSPDLVRAPPAFREFVEHWTHDAFAAYVDALEAAANRAIGRGGDAEREAFRWVAKYEQAFWEMAHARGHG